MIDPVRHRQLEELNMAEAQKGFWKRLPQRQMQARLWVYFPYKGRHILTEAIFKYAVG